MTASTQKTSVSSSESLPDAALPPFWGRLETLWLLMAPLCALLYTLCLPLAPNDLWYHVRAGELIARGAIPTQNLMSNGIALDTPYYYQSWLAELGLFWTLKLGGLSGLAILRAACVTGALGLVAVASFRQMLRASNPPTRLLAARLTALGAVVGLAMASNNVDLRPQTFSMLFFGAWIFAVLEFRALDSHSKSQRRFWGAFLVILTLLWANTHGAFIISILGLGALALGDFLVRRDRFVTSLCVLLAAGAAALLNPRGAGLYAYVANLSRDGISQKWVQEWKSPGLDDWHSALFWSCVAAIVVVFALSLAARFAKTSKDGAARGDLGWPLLLVLLGVMAARDQRAIIWFALALVPALAAWVQGRITEKPAAIVAVPRAAQAINAFLLAILLALPLALLPQFKSQLPWPTEFKSRFTPSPTGSEFGNAPSLLLERTTPVVAAQWLLRNPPRGRLFTDMVCGSYLTYAGRGRIVPLCDPRIELFPAAFWEDYLRLSAGPADAAAIMQKRGFSDALLDRDTMPALVKRLRQSSQWRIVAQNGSTVLFRRLNFQK